MSTPGAAEFWGDRRAPRLTLSAIVLVAMGGLGALDWSLAKAERSEVQHEAQDLYQRGSKLLAAGRPDAAVEILRRAHSLARRNPDYELDLVNALMADGKLAAAAPLMEDILEREPNNGRANLTAARLALKSGGNADAEPFYHRAIYGLWSAEPDAHRTSARMELVDLLAREGKRKELLPELLPLEEQAGDNIAIQHRLASLFLTAGSPARAVSVYQKLIGRDPTDIKAYLGIGEAELERGRYIDARNAFLAAFRRQPDVAIRQRMELASTMTALDPTARRLPSAEKYRRSLRILELAGASLRDCSASSPAAASSNNIQQLLGIVQESLSSQPPAMVPNELAEGKLTLSEEVWRARVQACGSETTPKEEPLRLIMEKLAL